MAEIVSELKKRVDEVLANHPESKDFAIETMDKNGVIYLTGTVDTKAKKQLVEKLVKEQKGVTGVVNNLGIEFFEEEEDPLIDEDLSVEDDDHDGSVTPAHRAQ